MFLEITLSSCCLQEPLPTFSAWGPNLILLMVHLAIVDIEQLLGSSLQSSLVAPLLRQMCATLEQIELVTGVEVVSHCT